MGNALVLAFIAAFLEGALFFICAPLIIHFYLPNLFAFLWTISVLFFCFLLPIFPTLKKIPDAVLTCREYTQCGVE